MNAPLYRPPSTAPILIAAERYVADYEAASRTDRESMEKAKPGHYAACLGVIEVWAKPDDQRQSQTPEARAEVIARVTARYRTPTE